MKQRIDMRRIKADILSVKQSKKIIGCVTNNALFVVEDVCMYACENSIEFSSLGSFEMVKILKMLNLGLKESMKSEYYLSELKYGKRLYFVYVSGTFFCSDRKLVAIYDEDLCYISDDVPCRRFEPEPVCKKDPRGTISTVLLNSLSKQNLRKAKDLNHKILTMICFEKEYFCDPRSDGSPDYFACLFGEGYSLKLDFNSSSHFFVEPTGQLVKDQSAFVQTKLYEPYHVVISNQKLVLAFPAKNWKLSPELAAEGPKPDPAGRQQYLEKLRPALEKGIVREIYGNDTVSVLNLADFCYAFTDYRCSPLCDGLFLLAAADHVIVKSLFAAPEILPFIMETSRIVKLGYDFFDRLSDTYDETRTDGPFRHIDPQMDADIRQYFKHDIFAES